MSKATELIMSWLKTGAFALFCASIGWLANQYMDFRSSYRDALEANYESFNEVARDIEQSLKQFADVARGTRPKDASDVENLQLKLLSAVTVAEDLQRRMKADNGLISQFKSAAVELQRASEGFSGPLDGKPMVQAVDQYLFAEQQLRDAVLSERNSLF